MQYLNPVHAKIFSIDNGNSFILYNSKFRSEDLYSGLRYLTGVESLEVTDSTEGGVKLLITIGECHLALTLDAEKCLSHIKVSRKYIRSKYFALIFQNITS